MKILCALVLCSLSFTTALAGDNDKFLQMGVGLLYERGMEATISYEKETRYHNAWEYSANVYTKWETCDDCQRICPKSFFTSYNSWNLCIAYKPRVSRSKHSVGRLRLGVSGGSDTQEFLAGLHVGYEHNWVTKSGVVLFWQVKTEYVINGKDSFKSGLAAGVKFPL